MRRLILLDPALEDLAQIVRYITTESGNRSIGRRFRDTLRGQCKKLSTLPGTLGTARPDLLPGLRSFAYKNYVIFFRYNGNSFEVVNILDGSRDMSGFFKRGQ